MVKNVFAGRRLKKAFLMLSTITPIALKQHALLFNTV
jgi:hypothetical protein